MYTQQNNTSNQDRSALDHKSLLELGDNLLSIGEYEQAQQCYERAAVIDTDNPAPYIGIGIVALQNQLMDEAELAFRVACRLEPGSGRAFEGLGAVAQGKGDYETAFEMYLKCLELDPDNLAALLGLFQVSMQMGSFAKIIYYLELYLKMHPDDGSVMFTLATLYIREDRYEKSREMLHRVRIASPGNVDAENLLEEIERKLNPIGRYE